MKLIGITANEIVSRSCPKKGKDLSFTFNGCVEWVCTESKKGIDSYDEIETTVDIDINEFLECFDTKTINELKKALINHIKTK
jgi:hypothetical protein|tara:strand:+ start:329 stop:577 length:249 start_codon:yes stop_codon:yes gene_type:complete